MEYLEVQNTQKLNSSKADSPYQFSKYLIPGIYLDIEETALFVKRVRTCQESTSL